MNRLFIDFETFFDVGYSLRSPKVAMSEYVRDPRFKCHMMQWAFDDEPVQWCDSETIPKILAEFDWPNIELVAHNAAFDAFIVGDVYGYHPARYSDTMLMSRAHYGANLKHGLDDVAHRLGLPGKQHKEELGKIKGKRDLTDDELEALATYGIPDVEQLREVYKRLVGRIPPDELDLMDLTLLMFCKPVLHVDRDRVQRYLEAEVGKKAAKLLTNGVSREQLSSNELFAQLLEERGIRVPKKISPATGNITYAFSKKDPEFLALVNSKDPATADLMSARLTIKSTIGETRAERFLAASQNDKRLPVLLNYCGAHTTRWSAGNKMNMQNLQQKGELRKSILAPPGHVIITSDSAQIEARTNLWLAGDTEKLQLFRDYDAKRGSDPYKVMASRIFGKNTDEVTDDERQLGKICVLALQYGMGAAKLQDTLQTDKWNPRLLPLIECRRIVDIYRDANMKLQELWKTLEALASFMFFPDSDFQFKAVRFQHEKIVLPSGLAIHYNKLRGQFNDYTNRYVNIEYFSERSKFPIKLYGGLLDENITQALARCVVAEQMLVIAQRYRIVMMTHDEISFIAPEDEADEAQAFALQVMRTPPVWAPDLPVNAEAKYARYYCK